MYRQLLIYLFLFTSVCVQGSHILIPMDEENQKNHLKAYGIAYWVLQNDIEIEWLLNYRGGSFLIQYYKDIEKELTIRGVSYEIIADVQAANIKQKIADPEVNQDVVRLEKAPKVAIYSPKNKQPWDDAVTLALKYAEIPYEVVYDEEVLSGLLPLFDWLHLHHEDFTGQYGKFYVSFKNATWYKEQKRLYEQSAKNAGFSKVSQHRLDLL